MLRYLLVLGGMVFLAVATAFVSFQNDLPPLPDDEENRGTFIFSDSTPPQNLDPNRTSSMIDFRLVKCLYSTLLVYEFGGEGLEPGAATNIPEPTNDGKTYTFYLREDAKWSDGEPVTAHDFVYGWRRAMLPDTGSDYHSLFNLVEGGKDFYYFRQGLLNFESLTGDDAPLKAEELAAFLERFPELERQGGRDADGNPVLSTEEKWALTERMFDDIVGVKALDDYTLEITLEVPTAFFIELCAFPTFSPVPEHVVEQYTQLEEDQYLRTDADYWTDPDKLVTNGPYTLTDYNTKRQIVLDQNPHYWAKDEMGNLRIIERIISDETLALLQFKDGQLHWVASIGQSDLRAKLRDSGYEHAHTVPSAGVYYYQFNCRETYSGQPNPFSDRRVRQAFSMCIPRQLIVDNVSRNKEPVALTFVPENQIPGYRSPVEAGLPYDPERARELLAEAGYPGGEGLPPIALLANSDGTGGGLNIDIAEVLQKVWVEELGAPAVNIQQPTFQIYIEESKKGNFLARRAGWFGDYRDPTTWLDMLRTGDANNDAAYSSAEFDGLLEAAAVETDAQARLDLLTQAEALLLQDAPITPLYYYASMLIYDKDNVDIGANPWNNLRLDLIRVERD